MSLFDTSKPTWNALVEKLRGKKSPVYEVYEISGQSDLSKVRSELSSFYGRHRNVSVVLVKEG